MLHHMQCKMEPVHMKFKKYTNKHAKYRLGKLKQGLSIRWADGLILGSSAHGHCPKFVTNS